MDGQNQTCKSRDAHNRKQTAYNSDCVNKYSPTGEGKALYVQDVSRRSQEPRTARRNATMLGQSTRHGGRGVVGEWVNQTHAGAAARCSLAVGRNHKA